MHFTIDRSKWRCGGIGGESRGKGSTALLNEEGYMCCLGQVARQIGCDASAIRDLGEPTQLDKVIEPLTKDPEWRHAECDNTALSDEAMSINDDETLTDDGRERKLTELFKNHGHTIEFTGKAVPFYDDREVTEEEK